MRRPHLAHQSQHGIQCIMPNCLLWHGQWHSSPAECPHSTIGSATALPSMKPSLRKPTYPAFLPDPYPEPELYELLSWDLPGFRSPYKPQPKRTTGR